MENKELCPNLHEYSNVCKMSQCIESVNGLPSTSTSNTDIWIVTFKDGVNYDHIPIKKGFVKIWLSRDAVKYKLIDILDRNYTDNEIDEHLITIGSLNYEAKVYRDIVKGLIESNICPNFIKFLGLGQNCSFEDVRKMLVPTLGDKQSKDALFRSAIALMKSEQHLSINKDASTYTTNFAEYDEIVENTTFTILINEAVRNNSQTDRAVPFTYIGTTQFNVVEVWKLLFQLMAAIYAMSLSGLTHNDLHTDNAWIEPCDSKDVSYVYGGETFNFRTRYVVKVFDFDRSYNKRLGDNPFLEEWACDGASQCNKYIPNLDAMKVMGYIYPNESIQGQQLLLDICAPNKNIFKNSIGQTFIPQNLLRKTWNNGKNLINPDTDISLTAEDYEGFSSVFYIMKKFAELAGIKSTPNSATRDNTYICNPDIFDINGRILPKKFLVDDNRIPNLESMIRQSQKEIQKNIEIDERGIITEEIKNEQLQNTFKEKQLLVDLYNKTMQEKRITELKLENKLLQDEVDTKDKVIVLLDKFGHKCNPGQYLNNDTGRCNNTRKLKPCGEGQERNKKTNRCKKKI
jgi:hypothetical protein